MHLHTQNNIHQPTIPQQDISLEQKHFKHLSQQDIIKMATTSMDTIIQEWLGTFRSIETRCSYRYDIQKFKRWMTSNRISFRRIQLRDLQQWQRTMGDAPADRRFISSVKSFFRYCFNQDYLSSNIKFASSGRYRKSRCTK